MTALNLKWFTLGRLKAIAAFLGAFLTFAVTLPALGLPAWVAAIAALCTFAATYAVPNLQPPAVLHTTTQDEAPVDTEAAAAPLAEAEEPAPADYPDGEAD